MAEPRLLFRDSGMPALFFGLDGRLAFVILFAVLSFAFMGLFFSFFLVFCTGMFCVILNRMHLNPTFLWLRMKNWTFGPVRRIETSWSYHNKRMSYF